MKRIATLDELFGYHQHHCKSSLRTNLVVVVFCGAFSIWTPMYRAYQIIRICHSFLIPIDEPMHLRTNSMGKNPSISRLNEMRLSVGNMAFQPFRTYPTHQYSQGNMRVLDTNLQGICTIRRISPPPLLLAGTDKDISCQMFGRIKW